MTKADGSVLQTHESFCRFCHVYGSVEVDLDPVADRVVAVRGDRENAVSRGCTCPKGRADVERIHQTERLLAPLERVGDRHVEIEPERALDEIRRHPGGHVFGEPGLRFGGVIPSRRA